MPSISAGEICVGVLEIGAAGSLLCLYLIEKTLDEDVDADSDGIIGSASGRELDNLVIQLRMQGLPFGKSVGMLPSGAAGEYDYELAGGFQTAPLLLPKGTCVQFAPAFLAHHCVTADCGKNSLSQNEDLSSATYLKPTFQMTSTDDAGHSVAEIFVGPAQMVSLLSNSIPEQEKVKDAKATNWFKSTGPCISRFMAKILMFMMITSSTVGVNANSAMATCDISKHAENIALFCHDRPTLMCCDMLLNATQGCGNIYSLCIIGQSPPILGSWHQALPALMCFPGSVAPEKDSDVKLYDQRSQVVNVFADKKEPTSNHDGGIKKLLTELGLLLIGGGFTVTICISIRVFVCRRSLRGVVQQQQMTDCKDHMPLVKLPLSKFKHHLLNSKHQLCNCPHPSLFPKITKLGTQLPR
uniref:Uncharacterized protein n=1 Tax=Leersia perrieri TaxID=77586 RepID=A0A0D9WE73_9ORYZ